MARCLGEELPEDALYLDDDITLETSKALNRSLNIMDRTLGFTDNTHVSKKGYPIDWRGLAMMMKFDQHDINQWEMLSHGRTNAVVGTWIKMDISPTIKKILDFLRQLQVYGLLRDPHFIEAIVDDVGTHKHREYQRRQEEILAEQKRLDAEERERKRNPPPPKPVPLQVAKPEWFGDAKNQLVISDATTGKATYFDAFVCYAREDIKFVKRMLKAMEGSGEEFNLKLCVDDRDFFVGGYKYTLTARIMEERCKRIVLVMSPDFVRTPMCEFQTEYALSLSPGSANKKLLPLMYRTCDIPSGLKHIAGLYYTRDELKEWFWPRLGGSLCADLQWNEEEDHQRADWDQISLASDTLCPASRSEIMSSPKLPYRSSRSKGSKSHGLSKSGSSSSLSSAGSFVKVDIVSDTKNCPSGSYICGATASPISKKKSKKPSSSNKPIQEEGCHEIQIHRSSKSQVDLKAEKPKSGTEVDTDNDDDDDVEEEVTEARPDPTAVDSSDDSDSETETSQAPLAAVTLGKSDTYIKEQSVEREPCEMVSLTDTKSEKEVAVVPTAAHSLPAKSEKKSKLPKFWQLRKKPKADKEVC